MDINKRYGRVHGEGAKNGETTADIPDGLVEWDEYLLAWEEYVRRTTNPRKLEDIDRDGGFGYQELKRLLRRAPATWILADPIRHKLFKRAPEDIYYDEDTSGPAEPVYSHIWYLGEVQSICQEPSVAPDLPILFDATEEVACPNCRRVMDAWIEWWTDYTKKSGVFTL